MEQAARIEFTSEEIGRIVKGVQYAAAVFTKYGMPPEGDTLDLINAGDVKEFLQVGLTYAAMTRKFDELARKDTREDLIEMIRLFLLTADDEEEMRVLDRIYERCLELSEPIRDVFVVEPGVQTEFDNGRKIVREQTDIVEKRKLTRLMILILMKVYFSKA